MLFCWDVEFYDKTFIKSYKFYILKSKESYLDDLKFLQEDDRKIQQVTLAYFFG